jgi:hypothetical protein
MSARPLLCGCTIERLCYEHAPKPRAETRCADPAHSGFLCWFEGPAHTPAPCAVCGKAEPHRSPGECDRIFPAPAPKPSGLCCNDPLHGWPGPHVVGAPARPDPRCACHDEPPLWCHVHSRGVVRSAPAPEPGCCEMDRQDDGTPRHMTTCEHKPAPEARCASTCEFPCEATGEHRYHKSNGGSWADPAGKPAPEPTCATCGHTQIEHGQSATVCFLDGCKCGTSPARRPSFAPEVNP